ncbi:MAG: succinylglutamate desuccinylase/aspartoacylase family protein, partial [Bacteroidales bacterium]|nr:succinylglutamate desuccinylase/aspartoacylase family protein [Bacteroidales bacterium]
MKKSYLFLSLALFMLMTATHGQWRPGEMEVKVDLNRPELAMQLHELKLNGDIYAHEGYALLYVIPSELAILKERNIGYEILKEDLNEYYRDFWLQRDQYHSYEEIIQEINLLTLAYSSICKKFSYGLSLEGRELIALKISDNVHIDEYEPEVMFDGGIHGDEIGGPENLIRFARFLCQSYGVDPYVTTLIDTREIWLYIMVNPDGRVHMSRYNSNGVDLNRDFGYMWNAEGSSTGYYSQVESKALRNCMYENQFVVHTSYHSGTVFLSYAWSYRPDLCPDQPHIHALGMVYANSSGYTNLPVQQGYYGMYPINGSTKDSYYGIMGSVGWSMELSMSKQPPTSQIQYYYEINEPAMLAMIEHAGFGIRGMVTDAVTGEPVQAAIYIEDSYPAYNDPLVGDFHKYLVPGTYNVKAVTNGYQTSDQTVTVTANNAATVNFSLQPGGGNYAYRVPACYIPNNNFDDEGTTYLALGAPDDARYSLGK